VKKTYDLDITRRHKDEARAKIEKGQNDDLRIAIDFTLDHAVLAASPSCRPGAMATGTSCAQTGPNGTRSCGAIPSILDARIPAVDFEFMSEQ
jgi:hypothetical protein